MSDRLAGLVPQPKSVRGLPDSLTLLAEPQIAAAHGLQQPAEHQQATGTAVPTSPAHATAAAVRRALRAIPWPADAECKNQQATPRITVDIGNDLAPDAYRLTITQSGIAIEAGGTPGAFYAAQSLRQLLLADVAWAGEPAAESAPPESAPPGPRRPVPRAV